MKKIINISFWYLLSIITFISFLNTEKLSSKYLIILPFILCYAVYLHYQAQKKSQHYLLDVIGYTDSKSKTPAYDYLRVLAMLMVIVTHAIQIDFSKDLIFGPTIPHLLRFLSVFCLCCNVIYFLLSGALLLPNKEEKRLFNFYVKRFATVGIPMIIYLLFYEWYSMGLSTGSISELKEIFNVIYQTNFLDSPHFWLASSLLSFYVIVPFLRYMLRDLPYKYLTILIIISIIWITLPLFVKPGFGYTSFISSWTGITILGYWVTRKETEKYYNYIFALGIITVIAIIYIIQTNENYMNLCTGVSPIPIFTSFALFCFVLRFKKIFNKSNPIISILSKYSYSIILLHWWSQHFITIARFNIVVNWNHGLGLLLSVLSTVFFSFAYSFIIDNLFVIVAKDIWTKICMFFYKCYKIIVK